MKKKHINEITITSSQGGVVSCADNILYIVGRRLDSKYSALIWASEGEKK